jgi:hypothetical protein
MRILRFIALPSTCFFLKKKKTSGYKRIIHPTVFRLLFFCDRRKEEEISSWTFIPMIMTLSALVLYYAVRERVVVQCTESDTFLILGVDETTIDTYHILVYS